MRTLISALLIFSAGCIIAQPKTEKDKLFDRLALSEAIPEKLLATRSVVLYDEAFTQKELEEAQKVFQQAGIDAVSYFVTDHVLSGTDLLRVFTTYLTGRSIEYLIFFEKDKAYTFTFARYNNTRALVDTSAPAWRKSNSSLTELLRTVTSFIVTNQKKQNLLVNDFPETDITLKHITGRRNENFTNDAISFKIAIARWGNEKEDAELEQILKDYFPVKYELVDAKLDDRELSKLGFRTVLRFVHTKGSTAKKILDYDLTQIARSLTTVYYVNGEADLKTIPANQTVYKFYVKHIEYGNLFLGKGWDADITWQDALKNHLQGMRESLQF